VPSVPLCFKPLFLNTEAQSPQSCPTGDSRQSIPHSTPLYLSPLPISPLHLFLHLSVPSVPLCFKPLFLNTEAQSPQSCPTGDSRQSIPHSTPLYLSPLPISPLHLFLHLSVPSVPLCFKPLFLNTEAQSPQSCPTGDSRQSIPHSTPLYLSPFPIPPPIRQLNLHRSITADSQSPAVLSDSV